MGNCATKRKNFIVTSKLAKSSASLYIDYNLKNNIIEAEKQHFDNIPVNKSFLIQIIPKALEDYYEIANFLYGSDTTEIAKLKHKTFGFERSAKLFPVVNEVMTNKRIQEFNILKALDHTNIIKIHEAYLEYNKCSFVFDYISSNDIFNTIGMLRPITEQSYVEIIKQLLKTIKYLHSVNIFHFNIRSSNILGVSQESRKHGIIHSYLKFTEKDVDIQPIFIDFSRAVLFEGNGLNVNSELYHYNEYTAPEVLKGKYTIKSEIYSIGIVIFKLVLNMGFYTINPNQGVNFSSKDWKSFISSGKNNLDSKYINTLTVDMQDFLQVILDPNPNNRPSIDDLLKMPLFKSVKQIYDDNKGFPLFKRQLMNYSKNHYLTKNKFYKMIVSQCILLSVKSNQCKNIINCFNKICISNNGLLTISEFTDGLRHIGLTFQITKDYKLLFEDLDLNKDKYITFWEFLIALVDKSLVLTQNNLQFCFMKISSNKDTITMKDMAKFLGITKISGLRLKDLRHSLSIVFNDILNEEKVLIEDDFCNIIRAIGVIDMEEMNNTGGNFMYDKLGTLGNNTFFRAEKLFSSSNKKNLDPKARLKKRMMRHKSINISKSIQDEDNNSEKEIEKISNSKKRRSKSSRLDDYKRFRYDPKKEYEYILQKVDKLIKSNKN